MGAPTCSEMEAGSQQSWVHQRGAHSRARLAHAGPSPGSAPCMGCPGSPGCPGCMSRVPGVPKVHGVFQVPRVPGMSGVPGVYAVPAVHAVPGVCRVPRVPRVYGVPGVYGVPRVRGVPRVHRVPGVPGVHRVPREAGSPLHSHGHIPVAFRGADCVVPVRISLEDKNSHDGQRGQTCGPEDRLSGAMPGQPCHRQAGEGKARWAPTHPKRRGRA